MCFCVPRERRTFVVTQNIIYSDLILTFTNTFLCSKVSAWTKLWTLPWPDYFAEGSKSFGKLSEFCQTPLAVTCSPYKEIHVTAKRDGKNSNNLPSILTSPQNRPAVWTKMSRNSLLRTPCDNAQRWEKSIEKHQCNILGDISAARILSLNVPTLSTSLPNSVTHLGI